MSRAAAELAHLFRALKAPAAARALPVLAERAREQQWSYERFAEALLSTEVSSRDSHGGEGRIKAARFPARETLEEFDFTFQRSVKKTVVAHLGQLDFLHARENVILLGPGDRLLDGLTGHRAPPGWLNVVCRSSKRFIARAPRRRRGLDRSHVPAVAVHNGELVTQGPLRPGRVRGAHLDGDTVARGLRDRVHRPNLESRGRQRHNGTGVEVGEQVRPLAAEV